MTKIQFAISIQNIMKNIQMENIGKYNEEHTGKANSIICRDYKHMNNVKHVFIWQDKILISERRMSLVKFLHIFNWQCITLLRVMGTSMSHNVSYLVTHSKSIFSGHLIPLDRPCSRLNIIYIFFTLAFLHRIRWYQLLRVNVCQLWW